MKRAMALAGAVFLAVSVSGCALLLGAAAGGAGAAYWLAGKLTDEVAASYEETVAATEQALLAMEMPVNKLTQTEETTQFKSATSDGKMVWVDVEPVTSATTRIEVRVGAGGDKGASSEILENIKKNI